jgi:hypothetical protein
MRIRKTVGALLTLGFSTAFVEGHNRCTHPRESFTDPTDGNQLHRHKRDADTCACQVQTTTTWIPYVPAEWGTQTTTIMTTQMVYVEVDDTTTVTVTEMISPQTTAPAKKLVKRGDVQELIDAKESALSVEYKEMVLTMSTTTTDVLSGPTTTISCDCFETVVTTWVPYSPHQFVIVNPEDKNATKIGHPKVNITVTTSSSYSSSSSITTTWSPPPAPPTTSSTSTTSSTTSPPPPPPPPATTSSLAPALATPSAVASPSPQAPANGGLYAITYTPYDESGGCKSAGAVLADLQAIQAKGFPRIRMYSTDCGQLSTVADQAISLGLQLTMGIFIDGSGATRGYSELSQLIAWGKWGNVDIINIGIAMSVLI